MWTLLLQNNILATIAHFYNNFSFSLFNMCVRCFHDTQLIPHTQTLFGKLLMNLCDPLLQMEKEKRGPAREAFLFALESFVKKFKNLADFGLPSLIAAEQARREIQQPKEQPEELSSPRKSQHPISMAARNDIHWQETLTPLQPHDSRNMIKCIINPVKVIAYNLAKSQLTGDKASFNEERELFNEFFVHGLRCLNQLMTLITVVTPNSQYAPQLKLFKKEEKEMIDVFASIFYDAQPQMFEYILNKNADLFMETVITNKPFQEMIPGFLSHRTSATTGSVLIKFLIKRMPEIGQGTERSKVYMSLFNHVFRTVSSNQNPTQETMLMVRLS